MLLTQFQKTQKLYQRAGDNFLYRVFPVRVIRVSESKLCVLPNPGYQPQKHLMPLLLWDHCQGRRSLGIAKVTCNC
jgi:hypothetical protein